MVKDSDIVRHVYCNDFNEMLRVSLKANKSPGLVALRPIKQSGRSWISDITFYKGWKDGKGKVEGNGATLT